MNRSRTILKLEALNARIVPSVTCTCPHSSTGTAIVHKHYALTGRGTGTYQMQYNCQIPNQPAKYFINGTANLADLGSVNVCGFVSGTGSGSNGKASGTLTLSNSKGTVTVEITGVNSQPGFSAPPQYFRYRIVSGTGQFKNLKETGTLRIEMQRVGPVSSNQGTFRVTI